MPELPEVEVVHQQLKTSILRGIITNLHIGRDDIVRTGLSSQSWYSNAQITDLARRGKCLIFTCVKKDEVRYLLAELGMTGLFLFQNASLGYEKHIHITLSLGGTKETVLHYWNPRRFGRAYLLDAAQLSKFLQRRFGPDPLLLTRKEFQAIIGSSRGRMKAFLLNQHHLAGIGNIYANEILHAAGIHPHARGNRLTRKAIMRLYDATQTILRTAITKGGSSIRDFRAPDGSRGQYQHFHRVYQKNNLPCPQGCPTSIQCLQAERRSFYCPTCQKRR